MEEKLIQLGFSPKEAIVYLALLEFGTQPASVIAKKTGIPRPTVLFLFQNLLKQGYIRKSLRAKTQLFFATPEDLQQKKSAEINSLNHSLKNTVKLLEEFKNPLTSQPKLTFFEGLEGCRKAYSLILDSQTEAYEIGAHEDLEKMGVEFMENFIQERSKRKVQLKNIDKQSALNENFKKLDKIQARHLKMFAPKFGNIHSSIVIFENKVLLLNLHQDCFAILIESLPVAETLKTIFRLSWENLEDN